jgi:hypothetical protein
MDTVVTNANFDHIKAHAMIEAEDKVIPPHNEDTPIDAMTDEELAAVVMNDDDRATRRKALTALRLREFTAGVRTAGASFTANLEAVFGKVSA